MRPVARAELAEDEPEAPHVVAVGDVFHVLGKQLVARAADDLAESVVDEGEAPAEIGLHDADGGLADDGGEALLAIAQGALRVRALVARVEKGLGHGVDLGDGRGRMLGEPARAEVMGGGGQGPERLGDAPTQHGRHQDAEEEEAEPASGHRTDRAPEGLVHHRRGHRDDRGPAAHVRSRRREVDGDPARVRAARPRDDGSARRRHREGGGMAHQLRVPLAAREDSSVGVHDHAEALAGELLLDDDVADVPGRDHGAQYVEEPHVLEDGHADREVGVGRSGTGLERTHRRHSGGDRADEALALALAGRHRLVAGGPQRIHELAARVSLRTTATQWLWEVTRRLASRGTARGRPPGDSATCPGC